MGKMGAPEKRSILLQAAMIAGFLFLWGLVSVSGLWFERLFPSPWSVLVLALDHLQRAIIWPHFFHSLLEVFWGFVIGTSLGLTTGLALGRSRLLGEAFEPLILSLAPVPKIILYPIFIWFLGIGIASRVAMGAASSFFPLAIYGTSAVRQVKPIHIEAARLLRASRYQLLTKVYLPAMLAPIWVGLRLGAAISIVGILLAETKLSQKGLGFLMIEYYNHFQIAEMYSVLLLIFCFAVGLNSFFGWVQRRIPALRFGGQIRVRLY
jgi:ABC-type nitrate/sulfonate/bicarbonate transport system permease component